MDICISIGLHRLIWLCVYSEGGRNVRGGSWCGLGWGAPREGGGGRRASGGERC